jgi:hypothetical protein
VRCVRGNDRRAEEANRKEEAKLTEKGGGNRFCMVIGTKDKSAAREEVIAGNSKSRKEVRKINILRNAKATNRGRSITKDSIKGTSVDVDLIRKIRVKNVTCTSGEFLALDKGRGEWANILLVRFEGGNNGALKREELRKSLNKETRSFTKKETTSGLKDKLMHELCTDEEALGSRRGDGGKDMLKDGEGVAGFCVVKPKVVINGVNEAAINLEIDRRRRSDGGKGVGNKGGIRAEKTARETLLEKDRDVNVPEDSRAIKLSSKNFGEGEVVFTLKAGSDGWAKTAADDAVRPDSGPVGRRSLKSEGAAFIISRRGKLIERLVLRET